MSSVKSALIKTPPVLRVVSLYILIASVLSVVALAVYPQQAGMAVNVGPVLSTRKQATENQAASGIPAKLKIERLGIDLPIENGEYNRERDEWTLSDDSVHFASMTSLLSTTQGNTFLYGHNTAAVLEPVKDLMVGDVLTIIAQDGRVFTYTYVSDVTVAPNRADIVTAQSSAPQVTLMTCEGWFSEARRVMYFKFSKAS